jgi:protein arginine kinase activator
MGQNYKYKGWNMLCELCKKRNAKIYVKKVENGRMVEYNLCEICASQIMGQTIDISDIDGEFLHSLSDLLTGFTYPETEPVKELKCQDCGMTYSEFQQTGKFGCGKCYETFSDQLIPLLKSIQGAVQHAGKNPPGKELRVELKKLKEDLKISIKKEEYERAAVIRDKIRELENDPSVQET